MQTCKLITVISVQNVKEQHDDGADILSLLVGKDN
jgi:hypothetical protein